LIKMREEDKRGKLILAFLASNNIIGKDLEAKEYSGRKERGKQITKQVSKRGKKQKKK